MSSHNSLSVSGSSPTQKKKIKWDFRVEHHGSICLVVPLSRRGCAWINKNIGADNGYQPYYPTVISPATSMAFLAASDSLDWWRDEQRTKVLGHLPCP
jgi:hypothetical protein